MLTICVVILIVDVFVVRAFVAIVVAEFILVVRFCHVPVACVVFSIVVVGVVVGVRSLHFFATSCRSPMSRRGGRLGRRRTRSSRRRISVVCVVVRSCHVVVTPCRSRRDVVM